MRGQVVCGGDMKGRQLESPVRARVRHDDALRYIQPGGAGHDVRDAGVKRQSSLVERWRGDVGSAAVP